MYFATLTSFKRSKRSTIPTSTCSIGWGSSEIILAMNLSLAKEASCHIFFFAFTITRIIGVIDPRRARPPIVAWLEMRGCLLIPCKLSLIDRSQIIRLVPQKIDASVDAVSWKSTSGSISKCYAISELDLQGSCCCLNKVCTQYAWATLSQKNVRQISNLLVSSIQGLKLPSLLWSTICSSIDNETRRFR